MKSWSAYIRNIGLIGRQLRTLTMVCVVSVLTGCAMVPPEPVVTGPLTAEPPPNELPTVTAEMAKVESSGSIYQPIAYGNFPLFEDRRPRNVGDIVTVVIQEKTNAAKNVATNTNREGSAGLGINELFGAGIDPEGFDVEGGNAFKGQGASRADNSFTGNITTTVIQVLPNGNLRIAGEKQIAINRGSEYIRFSGVVDPRSINGDNTVSSTKVADARIEFRSKGVMDETQTMGWFQRFFLNLSPF